MTNWTAFVVVAALAGAPALKDYTVYREKYIGEGKRGVVEMLRDMLCDESALCVAAKRPRKP
jgi:hypothetical protein